MNSFSKVKVNVLLISYNASQYIEQCVKSILMQKTTFKFNIIVADDCSSDDTLEKVKHFSNNCKNTEFSFLKSSKNLGINANYKRAFKACSAEYIAVIEGDDFWTDPLRLQKHIDFLDNHYECVMSSNNRIVAFYDSGRLNPYHNLIASTHKHGIKVNENCLLMQASDIICVNYGTNFSTCIYRKCIIDKLPDYFFDLTASEIALNIMALQHGFMAYFLDPMSVQVAHNDSITGSMGEIGMHEAAIKIFELMNIMTNKKFDREVKQRLHTLNSQINAIKNRPYTNNQVIPPPPKINKKKRKVTISSILKGIRLITPPLFLWIAKALIPKVITESIYKRFIN